MKQNSEFSIFFKYFHPTHLNEQITQEIHPVQVINDSNNDNVCWGFFSVIKIFVCHYHFFLEKEHIVTVIARGSEQQKQQEGENSGNSIENANNEFMEKIYEKVQQPIGLTNKQSSSSYGSSQTNIHGSAGDTGTGVSLSKATTKGGYWLIGRSIKIP